MLIFPTKYNLQEVRDLIYFIPTTLDLAFSMIPPHWRRWSINIHRTSECITPSSTHL